MLEANEGFCRLTGYDINPASDQTSLDLGIWVDLNERKRLVDQLQRDGFVRDFSCHIRRSDSRFACASCQPDRCRSPVPTAC